MTCSKNRWTEFTEQRAPLDLIAADSNLCDSALAALEEARVFAFETPDGSLESEDAISELLSVAKVFARSASDAKNPLVLDALDISSCFDAADWDTLSSHAEMTTIPSMEAVTLFLSKVEDFLHAKDGVPFTRPYLCHVKTVPQEKLRNDEYIVMELASYPSSLPPVIISLDDYRHIAKKMILDRIGFFDQRNKEHVNLRRFFKANAYDVESEEGTLVFVGWKVAKIMYSKSESAFAAKWQIRQP